MAKRMFVEQPNKVVIGSLPSKFSEVQGVPFSLIEDYKPPEKETIFSFVALRIFIGLLNCICQTIFYIQTHKRTFNEIRRYLVSPRRTK